ncbi:MAG: hypothetical protein JWM80_951 [Cyanobacteria bacterium RYN_339]|nr:hypothetical protein [Cyanobacteria bacterium RYN_339]
MPHALFLASLLLIAQADLPETLPLLGDGPSVAEAAQTFLWTHPYEFTYRPARWELERNDGNGAVRLRWGETTASLTISLDDAPVPQGAPTYKTLVGGVPAVETLGWEDNGDGRPQTLYDMVRVKRGSRTILLVLAVPEKHEGVADAATLEMRKIQQAWKWH